MAAQSTARRGVAALLKEAGLAVTASQDLPHGRLHELARDACGRRVLVFDDRMRGLTIAMRLELESANPLWGVSTRAPEALLLLGALTAALETHEFQAKLVSGERGLEAIMLSGPWAREAEADPRDLVERLGETAQRLEPLLALSELERARAILSELGLHVAELADKIEAVGDDGVIAPTFDEAVRAEMMARASR